MSGFTEFVMSHSLGTVGFFALFFSFIIALILSIVVSKSKNVNTTIHNFMSEREIEKYIAQSKRCEKVIYNNNHRIFDRPIYDTIKEGTELLKDRPLFEGVDTDI